MNSHRAHHAHTVLTAALALWITLWDGLFVAIQLHIQGPNWPSQAEGFPMPAGLVFITMTIGAGIWHSMARSEWGRTRISTTAKHLGYLLAFFAALPLCIQIAWNGAIISGRVHGNFGAGYWVVSGLITAVIIAAKVSVWHLWWRLHTTAKPWSWWAKTPIASDIPQTER